MDKLRHKYIKWAIEHEAMDAAVFMIVIFSLAALIATVAKWATS